MKSWHQGHFLWQINLLVIRASPLSPQLSPPLWVSLSCLSACFAIWKILVLKILQGFLCYTKPVFVPPLPYLCCCSPQITAGLVYASWRKKGKECMEERGRVYSLGWEEAAAPSERAGRRRGWQRKFTRRSLGGNAWEKPGNLWWPAARGEIAEKGF